MHANFKLIIYEKVYEMTYEYELIIYFTVRKRRIGIISLYTV